MLPLIRHLLLNRDETGLWRLIVYLVTMSLHFLRTMSPRSRLTRTY